METRSYALLFVTLAVGATHGQDLRSATADNLNLAGAWVDTTPPTNVQIATWDGASTLVNTMGANLAWGGLNVSAASGAVSISGTNTLAAGTINLGATNLSITTSTAANSLAFTSLTGTGNFTVSNSTQTLGLTTLNTANALNFNGTLTLRGGNAATTPAAVGTSFFYLGRTGITQAAGTSFALDTGSSATNAKDVIIDSGAWGGKTIQLSSLTGFGTLRRDSGAGGVQVATIDVNQAANTVFNGMVLSHITIPNTDIRRLDLTKRGAGSLTLAGIVGKQTQSAGGNPSDINLTVSGGTLVLTAANTRTGSATITAAGTLQAGNGGTTGVIGGSTITNDGALVYDYGSGATSTDANAISGSGTVTKKGTGALALTGTSLLTGITTVEAGLLRIGGALSTSPVNVASGASIGAGTQAAAGTGLVKSLSLAAGSTSTFRAGATFDQLIINDADGLVAAGAHVITAVFNGGLNPGDKVAIIDYTGTFNDFANLSLAPGSRFSLSHNVANTTIDLEYSGSSLIWTGGDGNWDFNTTPNWTLGGNPTNFLIGDAAVFNDTASTGNVVLVGTLTPSSVTIGNSTLAYALSGGTLGGTGTLTKQGNGSATITAATSYTGTTFIDEGTLTFGDGTTSGEIGSGPVAILAGATLRISRSDLLDYKTNQRLRNVSGAGDIGIDGGGTVFNYTGTGIGFSDANSWTGFSGNLRVKNGSEFRTIRNGSTAMGTGDVILGDATTSGKLSQIEGNWTWTNDIILTGADNRIINRSVGAPRLLKLQGVISGSGGLTFEDAAATMTNNQTGFILTGENTLDGTLTIPAGVPVRVGGVPGNTDATQNGAGIAGSLGSASVVNEGILTFSRTNAHTVANTVSGAGQAFIGLSTGSTAQVVTFTGTKSYSGPTIVRSGTLLVNTSLPNSPVVVEVAGTLGGTGTLGIASSVSGTLAPGNGVGTLTSTADIALENNSKVAWQVGDWNGSAGTGYDTLSVPSLTIGAIAATPITIVITGESLVNFSETAKTFTLATTSGGVSGLDAGEIIVDDTNAPGTGTWSVQVAGNNLELTYTLGDSYDAFESANGISGAGANTDSDGDGIPNGIEFVIGGDPSGPDSDSSAQLPTASVDATNLSFVFRRTEASAGFDPVVEYSSTLAGWTVAQGGVGDVLITEDNNFYGTGTDRVTVVIPRALAAGSTLFARLRIDFP